VNFELVTTAFLGILGGILTYVIQKWLDRREQVRARHYNIYVELVEAVCALANAHNREGKGKEDALSNYATAKMKFAIVASDNAMKRLVEFDSRITSGQKVPHDEFDQYLANLLREIRAENLGSTGLSNEELVLVTPFGRSLRSGG
jgi:hypothetical protein